MSLIILASNSPRRREILSDAGYSFEVMASDYDEKISGLKYSDKIVENCAKQKGLSIEYKCPENCLIVSADTVVVCDECILGKPKDKKDAFNMLQNLSNKTHFVATAVCLIYGDEIVSSIEKTFVKFRKLSEGEITSYIELKNPLDKAGSYAIQDEGFDFAIEINGEIDNVIGFPMKLFRNLLNKISFNV